MSYIDEKDKYQEMSEEFAELNKRVNYAKTNDVLTDDLELAFFKAERALREQYAKMQRIKVAESAGEVE